MEIYNIKLSLFDESDTEKKYVLVFMWKLHGNQQTYQVSVLQLSTRKKPLQDTIFNHSSTHIHHPMG